MLTEEDIRETTIGKFLLYCGQLNIRCIGSYQIKSAKAYIVEHLQPSYFDRNRSEFIVELCDEHPDLIRANFDSRHSPSKAYRTTIRYQHQFYKFVNGIARVSLDQE